LLIYPFILQFKVFLSYSHGVCLVESWHVLSGLVLVPCGGGPSSPAFLQISRKVAKKHRHR